MKTVLSNVINSVPVMLAVFDEIELRFPSRIDGPTKVSATFVNYTIFSFAVERREARWGLLAKHPFGEIKDDVGNRVL